MRCTHLGVYGIVMHSNKLLLIKKVQGPYTGLFDLPGGGIEFGETPEQALVREMLEETGLNITKCNPSFSDSILTFCDSICVKYSKDPDQPIRELHHIAIFYEITLSELMEVKSEPDGLDSGGALWFDLEQDDKEKLSPLVKLALKRLERIDK